MSETIGRYELLRKIDTGGMAEIFIAKQQGVQGFEKLVVIKKLLPEVAKKPQLVTRFLNEAKLAAQLTHPNIVQTFDLGFVNGMYFIAMEHVHGENLAAVRRACSKKQTVLPLAHTLEIANQACEGLFYAHTKTSVTGHPLNIVHCDVSPQNLLLSFDGVLKIVDFGVAKAATQQAEGGPPTIGGKLAYLSPEQCLGKPLDSRSDIFSLGVVLWELVTGKRLFGHLGRDDILQAILKADVIAPRHLVPTLPLEIDATILRALKKLPEERFQDAQQLRLALKEAGQKAGLASGTMELRAFIRDLFREKLDGIQKIVEAEAAGSGLEDSLFSDIKVEQEVTGSESFKLETKPPSWKLELPKIKTSPGYLTTGVPAPRSHRGLILTLIVLALLAAGTAGVVFFYPSLAGFWQSLVGSEPAVPGQDSKQLDASPPLGASVQVESTPTGAVVSVGGRARCTTPCNIQDLEISRPHTIQVLMVGYQDWTTELTFSKPGPADPLQVVLEKPGTTHYGELEVVTNPPGATIFVDGKWIKGVTPLVLRQVTADQPHSLRGKLSGMSDWVTGFKLRDKQHLILRGVFSLAPLK